MSDLQEYARKRDAFSALCAEASNTLKTAQLDAIRETVLRVKKQLDTDVFRLMVIGEFSAGKSTFINALLGEKVLPAFPIPTTAFINEVRYGREKRALLHFLNPLPEFANCKEFPGVSEYVKKYAGGEIPPMEIPVDHIGDYAVIPMGMEQAEANRCTPFEKLELLWPLDYLKRGIEIIDSPGLNEAPHRTIITNGYIRNADAVLFLTLAQRALSESELRYVDNSLNEMGFANTNTFLMTTYFDQTPACDQAMVRQYVPRKAKGRFRGCYFVSAYNALRCKEASNRETAEAFDFWEAEKTMIEFLTDECGNVRLESMRAQMRAALTTECERQLGTKEKLLSSDVESLKLRVQKAEPELKQLEKRAANMEASLNAQRDVMLNAVDIDVRSYYADLGAKLNGWASEFEPQTQIRMLHLKKDAEVMTKEYSDYLLQQLSRDQEIFFDSTLIKSVDRRFTDMVQGIGMNIELFFRDLQALRNRVTGSGASDADSMPQYWKDALRDGISVFSDSLSQTSLNQSGGAQIAWKNILKSAATAILLVFSPLSWAVTIAGTVVAFLVNRNNTVSQAAQKCRDEVVRDMSTECATLAPQSADKISQCLRTQLDSMIGLMMKDLTREVDDLRKQFEEAVRLLTTRSGDVKCQLELYAQCRRELGLTVQKVDQLFPTRD